MLLGNLGQDITSHNQPEKVPAFLSEFKIRDVESSGLDTRFNNLLTIVDVFEKYFQS